MKITYVRKNFTVGMICLLILMSIPITVSNEGNIENVIENNYISRFGIISLKAESADLRYADFGHIGRLWLPIFPIRMNIHEGETELKINGKTQEFELPVYIMLRRFLGIGPLINESDEDHKYSVNFFGLCGETIVIPYDLFLDDIHEQPLFDVHDIKDFGQTAYGLTSADFNDDNYVDFAVSSATCPFSRSTISLFYNDGNLGFTQDDVFTFSYSYIEDLDSGDYDNDGDNDLMFTYSEHVWHGGLLVKINGVVKMLVNDGNNNFGDLTQIAWHGPGTPYDPENRINPQLASADYDMDGDIDFLIGDNSGKVEFYVNNGSRNFTSEGIIHDWGHVSWGLTSDDFDGDGDIDFLVAAESEPVQGYIYLKRNQMIESNFTTCFDPGPGEILLYISYPSACLQSFDYDADDDVDFIAGIVDAVYLCINKQDFFDVFFLGHLPPNNEGYIDDLSLGGLTSSDYNNDGKEDIVVGGVQGVVRLCINNFGQLPPLRPAIKQPSEVQPRKELEFGFVTKDVNDDDIYYFIDWGDGTNSGWIGPYASGEEIAITHSWRRARAYTVRAKAKDDDGESSWREYILILFPSFPKRVCTSLELVYPFSDYSDGFQLFTPTKQGTSTELESVRGCKDNTVDYRVCFNKFPSFADLCLLSRQK